MPISNITNNIRPHLGKRGRRLITIFNSEEFMKSLFSDEGKGTAGCIFALFLMVVVIFLAIKFVPPYLNHYEFKSDMKQAVSRAGARSITDDNIRKDLIQLAQKNKIVLKNENIQISRFAGQIVIRVKYTIPINLLIMNHEFKFENEESSYAS